MERSAPFVARNWEKVFLIVISDEERRKDEEGRDGEEKRVRREERRGEARRGEERRQLTHLHAIL